MSHGKLRQEKDCLNCGREVEGHYCSHCGQENSEPRQPFHYLFTHFFEDFTHYDSQFWKTIKYLLFKPGLLSKEYIKGKRQQYVPPVKLYIFVSFVTFLLLSIVGIKISDDRGEHAKNITPEELYKRPIKLSPKEYEKLTDEDSVLISNIQASSSQLISLHAHDKSSLEIYDSIAQKEDKALRNYFRPFAKKVYELREQGKTENEVLEAFVTAFMKSLPKALFFYLPAFAFLLWLFHHKKRWWYFDHGIFTLHYFSFLLIGITIGLIFSYIYSHLLPYSWFNIIKNLLHTALFIYSILYFFIAHKNFYESSKGKAFLIGVIIFIGNLFLFMILLLSLARISAYLVH